MTKVNFLFTQIGTEKFKMTYQKIYELKFRKKVPTFKLKKIFPNDHGKIYQIALMELPVRTLKRLVRNEKKLVRLLLLKKTLTKRALHS